MANLGWILKQLQGEQSRTQKGLDLLDEAIAAFEKLVGAARGGRRGPTRRKLSAAARRRISRAQKARWAKSRQQKKAAP